MTAYRKVAVTSTMTEVQIISAPWCKRCHTIKPEILSACALSGLILTAIDYDEMEETEKTDIKSLPTIRMRSSAEAAWDSYTADTLAACKIAIAHAANLTTVTDF
jgi:hypothetical protein